MGAWIEIARPGMALIFACRRPRMGAWIEIAKNSTQLKDGASPPYGGVD